jgi:hypothetical protein
MAHLWPSPHLRATRCREDWGSCLRALGSVLSGAHTCCGQASMGPEEAEEQWAVPLLGHSRLSPELLLPPQQCSISSNPSLQPIFFHNALGPGPALLSPLGLCLCPHPALLFPVPLTADVQGLSVTQAPIQLMASLLLLAPSLLSTGPTWL